MWANNKLTTINKASQNNIKKKHWIIINVLCDAFIVAEWPNVK